MQENKNSQDIKEVDSDDFKCVQCGSVIKFKPGTNYLECAYCNTQTPIDVLRPKVIHEFDFNANAQSYEELNLKAVKVFSCRKCGAQSTFSENIKSADCPYCLSPLVESDANEERLIKPAYMLPFHVTEEAIKQHLAKWMKSLWFAPNKLKKKAEDSSHLQGVYIPCWTYDAMTQTWYKGERGDNYTVTVGSGKDRRTETRTRWSYASGQVDLFFDDLLVPASHMVETQTFYKLGSWDLKNLLPSDNRFMSGFVTEKYGINLRDGFAQARHTIDRQVDVAIRDDIGGDHQRISDKETQVSDVKFKLLLLPVYVSSYMYNNKLYHYYVNARTGAVTGKRPYSAVKITLLIIFCIALIITLVLLYKNNNGGG